MSIITSGAGKANSAKVGSDLRLRTAAVVKTDEHVHADEGDAFYMNSAVGTDTLTATATGGTIMYLENTDSTGKNLIVQDIQVSASAAAGIVRIIRNPVVGTIADETITVPVNENFGSNATAAVTAFTWDEVNDGLGGLSLGVVIETFIAPVGVSVVDVGGRYILNQGDSIAIDYLAKAGEITIGIRFYMEAEDEYLMGLSAYLTDKRNGSSAKLEDGALTVVTRPWPPLEEQKAQPFRQFLTTTGLVGGTSDMQAVGTLAAPIEFWIPADKTNDRYVTSLSFVIADQNCTLALFGTVTALTNGCRIFYERSSGEINLHSTLKTNFDFVQLCLGQPAFGDANTAFRAANIFGSSEAYIPVLDLTVMNPPFGIRLSRGTQQRLVLQVRDTTTGVDRFDCVATGFDRLP